MSLSHLTELGYGLAVLVYLASFIQYLRWFSSQEPGRADGALKLLVAGLVVHALALVFRGIVAKHAPWGNQYESLTFVSFGVVLLFLVFQRKNRVPIAGLIVVPLAILAIASATMLPQSLKAASPLMPALDSYWIWIHVSCLLVAYGSFATTGAISILYLLKGGYWTKRTNLVAFTLSGAAIVGFFAYVHSTTRDSSLWDWYAGVCASLGIRVGVAGNGQAIATAGLLGAVAGALLGGLFNRAVRAEWLDRLPALRTLDELNYRSVALGFPLLTLGIILGAFWGHVAWGRYWAWDPKETWSFISWLVYGFFLHFRISMGWQGPRLAWIGLGGFVCIIFTYWGVNFLLSGLHAYAAP